MIRKPELPVHETAYKRIFLLDKLPLPLTRADEHWQIFDDYTAWPEFRLRQIRVPQTREWFRVKEKIDVLEAENGPRQDTVREILPNEDADAHGPHPDKEIRKNRYFYQSENIEFTIDIFLGRLWGLILAEANFSTETESARFSVPEFAVMEVSRMKFFQGENLVKANFEEVKKEFTKIMGN